MASFPQVLSSVNLGICLRRKGRKNKLMEYPGCLTQVISWHNAAGLRPAQQQQPQITAHHCLTYAPSIPSKLNLFLLHWFLNASLLQAEK